MQYPFLEKIKKLLEGKEKTIVWLAGQVGLSTKTIYNTVDINTASLEYTLKLSKILQFDFLKDYNEWLIENHQSPISTVNEPPGVYEAQKGLTVEVKVTGSYNAIGLHFADFLKAL